MVENSEGGLVNSLFPVIRADLGMGLGALGVLTSIGKFARMIFGPFWATLGDRYGRKLILVVTALWGGWMLAAGFAQSYAQLLVLYGIGVIGTVAGEPISNGLVSDLFKPEERGKVYGTMRSITSGSSVLLTPLIGQLANVPNNQGWRIGMYLMGASGVLAGLLAWRFVAEPRPAGGAGGAPRLGKPAVAKASSGSRTCPACWPSPPWPCSPSSWCSSPAWCCWPSRWSSWSMCAATRRPRRP